MTMTNVRSGTPRREGAVLTLCPPFRQRDMEPMDADIRGKSIHASGNVTAAHTLACEWIRAHERLWRAWVPPLPPCTEDDWNFALAESCFDGFLPRRRVHFSWRHPNPQEPGTPTNCEGGEDLPTGVTVLCGHINTLSGVSLLNVSTRGLALLATLAVCAILLFRSRHRRLRKRLFGVRPEWLLLFFILAAGSSFLSAFTVVGAPTVSSCVFRGLVPATVALFISHLFSAILWTVQSYSAGSDGGDGTAGFDSASQLDGRGDSASTLPTRMDTGRSRGRVQVVGRTRSGEIIQAGVGSNTGMSSGAGTLCLIFSVLGFEVCVIVLVMIASGGGEVREATQEAWFGTYTQAVCGVEGGGSLFAAFLITMILVADGVAIAIAASAARSISSLRFSTERFLARAFVLATRLLALVDVATLVIFAAAVGQASAIRLVIASIGYTTKTVLVFAALLWPFFTTVVLGRPAPVYKSDLAVFSLVTSPEEVEHLAGKIATHVDGSVYQARWRGRDAVVKQPACQALSRSVLYSVRAYCLRMAGMRHPNVCALFAMCEAPLYLVMEHAPKGSLLTVVETAVEAEDGNQRRLMRTAISVATDAARGMRYLHERGQLHGGLTPQNVLVSQTGRGLVSDAGYHHSVLSRLHAARAASRGSMSGGGLYRAGGIDSAVMAPEVLQGQHDSRAADVHAWGMVLYFAVFCQPPFGDAVPESVPLMIVRGDKPTRTPGLPQNESLSANQQAQLVELMERCWEMEPGNRPTFADIERRLPLIMSREAMTTGEYSSDVDIPEGMDGAKSDSSAVADSGIGSANVAAPFVRHRSRVAVPSTRPALPPVRVAGPRSRLPEAGLRKSEPRAPHASPPPATAGKAEALAASAGGSTGGGEPAVGTGATAASGLPVVHSVDLAQNDPRRVAYTREPAPAHYTSAPGVAGTTGAVAPPVSGVGIIGLPSGPTPCTGGVHSVATTASAATALTYAPGPAGAAVASPTPAPVVSQGAPDTTQAHMLQMLQQQQEMMRRQQQEMMRELAEERKAREALVRELEQVRRAEAHSGQKPEAGVAAAGAAAQQHQHQQHQHQHQHQQEVMRRQQQEMMRELEEERKAREALVRELEQVRRVEAHSGQEPEAGVTAAGAAAQQQQQQHGAGSAPSSTSGNRAATRSNGGGDGQGARASQALMELAGAETREELEMAGVDTERLELGPVIGKGQFGLIMKATYDGQEVAVKQLNISHTRKASRHLFLKECKIMLTVRHPNVVRVVGTARRDETLLLLMELCARGDLFHLIQRSRRRRRVKDHFRFVIHVLINIAEGMAHLHSQRVLHRDLKSMNVLLSQSWTAKVSDFGLSRVLLEHSAKTMTRCGSPIWAAPEILRGERYNELVDVYSFAIIAFECGEWTTPYPSRMTGLQIMQAVAFRGVRPIKSAQWPRRLWEMVTQGWEDDASKRPTFKSIVTTLKDMWEEQEQTLKDVI